MIEEEILKIENKLKHGFINGYEFYASNSFKEKPNKYKGVSITYSNLIDNNIIYYAPSIYIK